MRFRVGRRPLFFAATAVVCAVLIAPTPGEFHWVNYFTVSLAGFWAILLWIEVLIGRGRGERGAGL